MTTDAKTLSVDDVNAMFRYAFALMQEQMAQLEAAYVEACSERDALAMHPPKDAVREAVRAFLTKHPAQIGSKSDRDDYGSFVTTADLWALHVAMQDGAK